MKCIATLTNRMSKSEKKTRRWSWELVGQFSETNVIMFYLLSTLKMYAESRSKTALDSLLQTCCSSSMWRCLRK
jgi:hypothetical protein